MNMGRILLNYLFFIINFGAERNTLYTEGLSNLKP